MDVEKAEDLARSLMDQHGLENWLFGFSCAVVRIAECRYPYRAVPGRIRLSLLYVRLNDEAKVRDSILHEIAHALTPGDQHGLAWQKKCRELGCDPNRFSHDLERHQAVGRLCAAVAKSQFTDTGNRLALSIIV